MRQRKIKNLDEKLALRSRYIIEEPEKLKGRWSELTCGRPLMIEIGCGKGKFISEKATGGRGAAGEPEPEAGGEFCRQAEDGGEFWLGVEGHRSVALHALEKCEAMGLENVRFILSYVNSLDALFEDGEVSGVFLNFSDPWPKERHEKRRLTTGKRLAEYARVLTPGGTLEFRTDNDGLFEYTLGQIEAQQELELTEMTRDLHGTVEAAPGTGEEVPGTCGTKPGIVTTEYEEKFAATGKNINFLKLVRK